MPRTCNREGCGVRLVTKAGNPDFRKHFCGKPCKDADNKEKKAAKRNRIHGRKCNLCGRRPSATDAGIAVSRVTPVIYSEIDGDPVVMDGTDVRLRSERLDAETNFPLCGVCDETLTGLASES